jgi:CheY-like chemotaxis protein/anti-sigma regulatory factor (Ser/Thr protein kinase)
VLQRALLDLNELIESSLAALTPQLASHTLSLNVVLASEPALVWGDAVRLEQVLANLINNAVKYTPQGGHVRLAVKTEPEWVEICVEDDGVGIASSMLPRVFELFAQASATLDRAQGGMGIGLTLVKRLVELHGGSVKAESEGLGRGTTFTLRLPRCVGREAALPRHAGAGRTQGAQRKILVVEDNDDSRELLIALLRRAGHSVRDAGNGPAGVALALAEQPHVILIDIGLPGLDGYGVARRVRRALGRDVLLVALTGYGQPEDRARALDAGFDVHLTKPVDFARLEQLLTYDQRSARTLPLEH